MQDFEKLGQFYLGKEYDLEAGERTDNLLMYDSRDLCTHAVVVGMTGSGKTGLCVDLLEEAAIDRIPAIVIDPKGDISNLLLTFPNLTPEEFRPWIDEGQASRKGVSPEEFATMEAEKWKKGLAGWGQQPERIKKLRETVNMRIYTPGSNTGRPMTILKSFAAPGVEVINDTEALHDRIGSATSGLLALMGIDADPINSREHILISKLLESAWREGKDLNLGKLIGQIQTPPFERVGIMELDDFYPKKDRQSLAMTMNNLLASPSFSSWLEGEPLDIKRMLHDEDGKPCVSIVSISHLSDEERMFFVTIILNEMISWMRTQAGTSSLRALLYMDEVFGYFPPTKNPPSKQPMLTLLKQARAFGLGCVLATQNPVDLDYKGLSNAGTWFLGRLQTERDKARVLEGLEGASAQAGSSFDRSEMEETLAGLGSRKFLMNNVHEDGPVVFETRWAMSYLRGPLTRNQIQELVRLDKTYNPEEIAATKKAAHPAANVDRIPEPAIDPRQLIPDEVPQYFVEPSEYVSGNDKLVYRAALMGRGRLHYIRSTYGVDQWKDLSYLARVDGGEMPDEIWENAEELSHKLSLDSKPEEGAEFDTLPGDLQKSKNFKTWQKELKEFLYREKPATVWKCEELKKYSDLNETLGDFKVRLEQLVSELRDEEVEKLRKKYAKKFSTLRDQIRRAEDRVEVEKDQYAETKMASRMSIGTTILNAILGRRNSRSASTSMRSLSRSSKEKNDIERAEEKLEDLQQKFEDLNNEFNDEVNELSDKLSVDSLEYDDKVIPPRKSDLSVEDFGICWLPLRVTPTGIAEAIY
ncbi:MAG: DUF87 domain-containing protein [Planctomycetota bacterium]